MDATTAALIGLIALALLFDFTNGWRAPSAADLEEATEGARGAAASRLRQPRRHRSGAPHQ
jgi:hypothetical protein